MICLIVIVYLSLLIADTIGNHEIMRIDVFVGDKKIPKVASIMDNNVTIETQLLQFCFDNLISCQNLIEYALIRYESNKISYPFYSLPLTAEEELSLGEMANNIAFLSCSNYEARRSMNNWFDSSLNSDEYECWFRPNHCIDRNVKDEEDHLRLRHPSIPCDSRYWIKEGIWLPRVFWSAPQHKEISPLRCKDRNVIDCGVIECPNKTAALLYECDSDINYLCSSMIVGLMEKKSGCMMYTVGIGGKWSFEDFVAENLGCEVHGMDPSPSPLLDKHLSHQVENVYFHHVGLSHKTGRKINSGVWEVNESNFYDNSTLYLSLYDLWKELGHASLNKSIDILRIDCEGCEFQALHQIVTETPDVLSGTSMIIVEMHITYILPMGMADQLRLYISFWENYIKKLGFRIWFVRSVNGWERYVRESSFMDVLEDYGFEPRKCCYEIGLYRELVEN